MSTSGILKIPSANQNVKLFPLPSSINSALWFLKKDNSQNQYIEPGNDVDVLIPKNLIVKGSIINTSDLLLKENIIPIKEIEENNSLNSILELNPVKYNYKNDENKKQHYGFIAQELEKYFPQLITEINTDINDTPIKTVNYIELIPIMLSKMQEMQNEIDELKSNFKFYN
jgi:hypothetical protein